MRTILMGLLILALGFAQSRPVPPPGVEVPAKDRADLQAGLRRLGQSIEKLRGISLVADVQIFHDAVRYALTYNEFFKPEEIARGRELLRQGQERADQLAEGRTPWTTATGLVVRGYVSKIDKSVQPYGLVVPAGYTPDRKWRLDTWFHGRGETLSEVNFLFDRQRNPGEFAPSNAIVLHLYGRYCNANKLAGEVDLFEALEAVKKSYPIDENRIVVRGFSMGGAAVWHMAAHYAGEWAAAAPGAGFSETPEFLKLKGPETWWEGKLWHLYNATDYAANFYNLPLVAYSGEIDGQKQAADAMDRKLTGEGLRMTHIIGPNTPHRYHPDSKVVINSIIDPIAEKGRELYPRKVRFTTWTLRYNKMKWVTVDSLDEHWERARLDAELVDSQNIAIQTANVRAFTLEFGPAANKLEQGSKPVVTINTQKVQAPGPMTDGSWKVSFKRDGTRWSVAGAEDSGLRKRHGLQGPIDDAFMDSFIFVQPTGTANNENVQKWVEAEMNRAVREWRKQFRGDAQVRKDSDVTDEEIASSNLVLWGDAQSNKLLARIADKLPMKWPEADQVLLMIYPNPLNPKKYVVLNSGFTFREFDYLNNARQVPKLPDYAIVDVRTLPDDKWPGKVVKAGFFDENWKPKNEQSVQRSAR